MAHGWISALAHSPCLLRRHLSSYSTSACLSSSVCCIVLQRDIRKDCWKESSKHRNIQEKKCRVTAAPVESTHRWHSSASLRTRRCRAWCRQNHSSSIRSSSLTETRHERPRDSFVHRCTGLSPERFSRRARWTVFAVSQIPLQLDSLTFQLLQTFGQFPHLPLEAVRGNAVVALHLWGNAEDTQKTSSMCLLTW